MPKQDFSTVKQILSDQGYSWTKPREIVFKAISSGSPRSVGEIIKIVQKRADRVSVYRTIELYESLGIVHRINVGWKYRIELSDQFVAHHHHLSCLKCGKIIDIEDEKHIDEFISQVASQFNFEPRRHQFEIEGLCSDCQAKQQLA